MKKCLMLVLVLCCLASAAQAYPSLEEIGEYARVNNPNPQDRLHLRTGPGSGYASLGKYYNGTVCEILEGSAQKEWVKVRIYPAEAEGWMMTRYLAFGNDREKVQNVQPRTETRDQVNLRTGPLRTYPVIESIPARTGLSVLGVVGEDWTHVQWENLTGYVMTQYLGAFEAPQSQTLYVNDPVAYRRLNLRAGAGTQFASLGLFCVGTPVEVLDQSAGWVRVRAGSLTGYMDKHYLADRFVSPQYPVMQVSNPVATHKLNLRQSPSVQSPSLGRYGNGARVSVMGYLAGGEWAWVQIGQTTGYMMLKYLQ